MSADEIEVSAIEGLRALVLAECVSEGDALVEGLTLHYGVKAIPVATQEGARLALARGEYDLLLAPGSSDVAWLAEVAPTVTAVLLGYTSTPPALPSLLIIPDWPQPLDSLVRAISWHLTQRWSSPRETRP